MWGLACLTCLALPTCPRIPIRGEPPLLRESDVLVQTRGTSYRSAIVPEGIPALAAAGSLFVLRPDTSIIDPRFLVLFFNLPATQAALRKIATGTHILNIRREELAALEVPVPPLRDQRALIALGELFNRSFELEQRLHQLRLQELHALILGRTKKAGSVGAPPASKERSARRYQRPQAKS